MTVELQAVPGPLKLTSRLDRLSDSTGMEKRAKSGVGGGHTTGWYFSMGCPVRLQGGN